MRIFEQIRIKLVDGKSRIIRLFGIPIIQYDKINFQNRKKIRIYSPLFRKCKSYSDNPADAKNVFYLKVNLEYNYAFVAIQHWINIVNEADSDFYFVCDKAELKKKILRRIIFKNSNIKFIKSSRTPLKKIIKNLTTKNWENAGFSHLTTFYHAKKLGLTHYWNIDADDTSLVVEPKKAVEILRRVSDDANARDVDIASLDMWRSRSKGVQWTFGVTYTRSINKFIQLFNKSDDRWKERYRGKDHGLNVDWFLTYLLDNRQVKAESFYVENMYFIHWCRDGNFISNPLGSYICYWHNGRVIFPIFKRLFQNAIMGESPISHDCVKYDCNIHDEEGPLTLQNRLSYLGNTRKELAKLWHVKLM